MRGWRLLFLGVLTGEISIYSRPACQWVRSRRKVPMPKRKENNLGGEGGETLLAGNKDKEKGRNDY